MKVGDNMDPILQVPKQTHICQVHMMGCKQAGI